MLVENLHAMAPGASVVYLGTTSSLDLTNGATLAVDAHLGHADLATRLGVTHQASLIDVLAGTTNLAALVASADGDLVVIGVDRTADHPNRLARERLLAGHV